MLRVICEGRKVSRTSQRALSENPIGDERLRHAQEPLTPDHSLRKQSADLVLAQKADALHRLEGKPSVSLSGDMSKVKVLEEARAYGQRQPLKPGKKEMRLHRKPVVRRLNEVGASHSPDLGRHSRLVIPGSDVLDHRVRKHQIETAGLELTEIACVSTTLPTIGCFGSERSRFRIVKFAVPRRPRRLPERLIATDVQDRGTRSATSRFAMSRFKRLKRVILKRCDHEVRDRGSASRLSTPMLSLPWPAQRRDRDGGGVATPRFRARRPLASTVASRAR